MKLKLFAIIEVGEKARFPGFLLTCLATLNVPKVNVSAVFKTLESAEKVKIESDKVLIPHGIETKIVECEIIFNEK